MTGARAPRYVRYWKVLGRAFGPAELPTACLDGGATGPRADSGFLDAAYGALEAVRRRNFVIGGNTFATEDVTAAEIHQVDASP